VSGADSRRENGVREKGEERECGFDRDGIEEGVTPLNETMKTVKPGRTVILFMKPVKTSYLGSMYECCNPYRAFDYEDQRQQNKKLQKRCKLNCN